MSGKLVSKKLESGLSLVVLTPLCACCLLGNVSSPSQGRTCKATGNRLRNRPQGKEAQQAGLEHKTVWAFLYHYGRF